MATTTNFGWETPDDTDLVKDGAAAMRTLGNSIDASFVDLKGGTTGQVLSKNSNTDLDFTWVTSDDANAIQNTIVDAKGDLIAASAADTPARLAVGNNGETLVADSSATTGLRYNPQNALANPFINGGFDIWQRGTSISYAASTAGTTYHADRWQGGSGANQATTISRQSVGDTTNLPNIQYCLRWQRNSGQTGTGGYAPSHSIETANSLPFAGKTVTYSFYARKGANFSAASDALSVYFVYGTGTDQNVQGGLTGQTALVNGTAATLTTTWQRFAYTFTIPATATQLAAYWIFTPVGTAGAADYFEVTGVQLDVGTYTASSAPTFRRAGGNIAGELAACQRYYYRINADSANSVFGVGMNAASTSANHMVNFPVSMRVAPTSLEYSTIQVSDFNAYGTDATTAAFGSVSTSRNTCILFISGITGLTANQPSFLRGKTQNTSYVAFSAEL